ALVELLACGRSNEEVQADTEHPLVPALQRVSQTLGVLDSNLAFGIDKPALPGIQQPRRLQLDQLMAEGADDRGGWKWPDVQAQLYRQIALNQRVQPTGGNRARIGGNRQHAHVLTVEPQVVGPDFAACGRNQI